jgi:CBS domain-containing protein
MAHREVGEVMTADVVTVTPGTRFKELARVMAEHDVSALPGAGFRRRHRCR